MTDITRPAALVPKPTKPAFSLSRAQLKRAMLRLGLLAGIAGVGYFAYGYWTEGRFMVSTDDAYVQADYTTVAPKVSGYIASVDVEDNQSVKTGQVLARIDDRDFKAALAQARADVAAADSAIRNLDAQIALQRSVIEQEKANIESADASLGFAREERLRFDELARTGNGTVERSQQADSALREKAAALTASRAALTAAQQKIDVLTTQRQQAEAALAHAQAVADQAALNLSYTTITAPVDGTVGARSLRVGEYVQAGTELMAVVPLHAVYVVANYKETQLTHVLAGQPVEMEVDTFPGVKVTGHVDSMAPASGLEFALLPPDNATGNFTKIVQRIPVKILVDQGALHGLLRPGMSVEPVINTKPAAEAIQTAGSSTPAG